MGAEGLARIICIDSLNNHDNLKFMFMRSLHLPKSGVETFFLWGPRQTGKTTLLKAAYPDALWIDLLKADEYRRYLQNPELLRAEIAAQKAIRQVVIDEVQKVSPLTRRSALAP
jgi:predicted AAA+ superfamily ATPase